MCPDTCKLCTRVVPAAVQQADAADEAHGGWKVSKVAYLHLKSVSQLIRGVRRTLDRERRSRVGGSMAVVITIVVAMAACRRAPPAFVSSDGRFSVAFPAAPEHHSHPVQDGPVALTRHVYTVSDARHTFLIQYLDLEPPAGMGEQAILDASREALKRTLEPFGGGSSRSRASRATHIRGGTGGFAHRRVRRETAFCLSVGGCTR